MLVDYASGAVSQVCAQPHSLQTPFCAHMNPLTTLATSHATPRVLAAIDPRACSRDPSACAAVQRVLERDPTLTWINGRFVPAHELRPPSPPPPPTPPPLLELYTRPAPLPFPPAPSPPPPWYRSAETCVPITTAAENNIDVGDGLERAVCVYVRAIADERVRATKCFEQMAPSPPPPPPVPRSRAALLLAKLVKIKDRSGQSNGPAPRPLDTNEEAYQNQHDAQTAAQLHLLDSLAEDNFQLRTLLGDVRNRISSFGGRRLWERSNVRNSHLFIENVLATEAFGNAPLVNVTIAECQALCHAIDNTTLGTCRAIAFARNTPNPRDLTLRQCYLLKQTGGCSGSTFAGAVFSRRDTDACVEPTEQENPLCIQLSNTRTDLVRKRLAFELHPTFPVPFPDVALFPSQRVLDFAAATTACRQGRGRPELAWPKTTLEVCHVFPTPDHAPCRRIPTPSVDSRWQAFSMLGYARERGISSFWSNKPNEGGTMAWSGIDGQPLVIPAGDKRCVLVSTVDTSIHGFMYAELKPCSANLADGVVCESAMAYPPPPPGGSATALSPPPPPPPIGVATSMSWFTRKEVIPRTSAICLAGLVETDLAPLCTEFANMLATSTRVGTVGSFTPLCHQVCFHSCSASSNQDRDGFENCRSPECADTLCSDFLLTCACILNPPRPALLF